MQLQEITKDTLDLNALQKGQGHKYQHGHALIICGDAGRTGAARLAATAAMRMGAGVVTLGVPAGAQQEVAAHITALMQTPINDANALRTVLEDDRLKAVCIGPGLGLEQRHADLVQAVLESGVPCVLDADALSLIGARATLKQRLGGQCVLTPHAGEFRRLFGADTDTWSGGAASCQGAARLTKSVVLYKGAETFIGHPDGRVAVHYATGARAVPWLATAGAGDVLAGMITGLVARDFDAFDAARYATWLHVEAARQFGPGLIAEDLPTLLPAVFRSLGI